MFNMASSPEPVDALIDKPLSELSADAFITVSILLTSSEGLGGRNWEGVAGKIGLSMGQVKLLKQHQEQNKGWLLLNTWENLDKRGATVKKLIFALESLKMRDCIDTLREDASISDQDIETARKECAQLVATGKLSNLFRSYSPVEFSKALYPHLYPRDPCPPPPPPATETVTTETCAKEELSQSSLDTQPEPEKPQLEPESVFISYCPESGDSGRKLSNKLSKLSKNLRKHGYTVYYDQHCDVEVRKHGGVDFWKEAHIKKCENILVICTPEYHQDDDNALMKMERSKVEVDRKLLRSIAYSNECDRLIPVMLDNKHKNVRQCVPSFVQASPLHHWPSKEKDLLYCLARMAKYQLPVIQPHERKVLKPIPIQVPRPKNARRSHK